MSPKLTNKTLEDYYSSDFIGGMHFLATKQRHQMVTAKS